MKNLCKFSRALCRQFAAFLAALSYLPQLRKARPRKSTEDLSLDMLTALTLNLDLWMVYGVMQGDWVIVLANLVGASLSGIVSGVQDRGHVRSGW